MLWLAVCFVLLEEVQEEVLASVSAGSPARVSGGLGSSRAQQQSCTAAAQQATVVTGVHMGEAGDVQEAEFLLSPAGNVPLLLRKCTERSRSSPRNNRRDMRHHPH